MEKAKNFALLGAAGYIAPRHFKAIKETENSLLASLDTNDSVGIIDQFFPNSDFFTEFERFDRHIDLLNRRGEKVDYFSICTPNYLHDSHIRFALKNDADVICEKPIVLNPWNVDALSKIEQETGRKVNTILQLRLHPSIINLKESIDSGNERVHEIRLTYITSRGNWYYSSWKGDVSKSGGIATNIGIHFFDMLTWIFGSIKENIVHLSTHDRASGLLILEKARVKWFMSINDETIPKAILQQGKRTYRSITLDGNEIEFSDGFTDLHTLSYQSILEGRGFGLDDARQSIETVYQIRNSQPIGITEDSHELAKLPQSKHPFKVDN